MIYFKCIIFTIFLYSCDFQGKEYNLTKNYYISDYALEYNVQDYNLSSLNEKDVSLKDDYSIQVNDKNIEHNCFDDLDNDNDNFFDCQDYDCCEHSICIEQNSGCK
jgi:hypothetical protein